jgi:hypothetical protein
VRYPAAIAATIIVVSLIAMPSWPQDSARISTAVFTNPGARSIGLGGAFAAIADDATAAFANPAGLIQILRPEISIELRATTSMDDSELDLSQGVSGLGFFSFVYPSRNWAVALYSHQLASVGFEFTFPGAVAREVTVRSYAASGALEIRENLSLGAGLSYFDGDRTAGAGVSGFSDSDWGFNLGVLWSVSRAWDLAGFYRQGPGFESRQSPTEFSLPDVYGFGVSFQPSAGALTDCFQWDQVGETTDPLLDGNTVTESGSEYHLGVEYAILKWKPVVALRAGLWREYGRLQTHVSSLGTEQSYQTEDRNHVSFGFGLAFQRFQLDFGADFVGQDFIGSASFVYSF